MDRLPETAAYGHEYEVEATQVSQKAATAEKLVFSLERVRSNDHIELPKLMGSKCEASQTESDPLAEGNSNVVPMIQFAPSVIPVRSIGETSLAFSTVAERMDIEKTVLAVEKKTAGDFQGQCWQSTAIEEKDRKGVTLLMRVVKRCNAERLRNSSLWVEKCRCAGC